MSMHRNSSCSQSATPFVMFPSTYNIKQQHCRRPMHFLSFFQEHQTNEAVGVEVLPAGAYVLPTFCEYCHAAHVSGCQPGVCRRPALYFQKKRPPFCKPNAQVWNTNTDEFLPAATTTTPTTTQPSSWLSMFSHSDGGD